MKKFVSILILGLISLSVFSQLTMKSYSGFIVDNKTWAVRINNGTNQRDSLGVYQDSIKIPITLNSLDSLKTFYRVYLKEVTSPGRVIVQFRSKKFASDSFVTRTSVTYTGVGTDSTIYVNTYAPYLSSPFQEILLIRAGNKCYLSEFSALYKK